MTRFAVTLGNKTVVVNGLHNQDALDQARSKFLELAKTNVAFAMAGGRSLEDAEVFAASATVKESKRY